MAAGKAAGCQGPLGRKEMAADEDDALPRSPGQLTDLPCVYEKHTRVRVDGRGTHLRASSRVL